MEEIFGNLWKDQVTKLFLSSECFNLLVPEPGELYGAFYIKKMKEIIMKITNKSMVSPVCFITIAF